MAAERHLVAQIAGKIFARILLNRLSQQGISLLKIAGKIFAHILLNHLSHLEQGLLPESQCGFRRHRGTTDVGISLLSIAGKIFARILLNRLNGQGLLPESQCGFRSIVLTVI
ncbi:unnamed protein product [Schistocephalus solidus]|uniref:Reverse transcriptase domain-containing protein n=1 Tax=Schistocephalus solidus TaxID=70667 RepID=A0A183T4L3_SCHSO|nr:unnamed protein product [Schistocephalus solidus]